ADLGAPPLYLNRELTWLAFERRVLQEALDARNPLLERVKFLAITASNLDEFFMKRIGGLKHQVAAGVQELTVDGRTPQQQIAESARHRALYWRGRRLAGGHQGARRRGDPAVPAGLRPALLRRARGRHRAQPRSALPRDGGRRVRALPRDAQCERGARRGRGR